MYWYDTELDSVERGLMNLAAAKVELIEGLESVDDVSFFIVIITFATGGATFCFHRHLSVCLSD